MMYFGGKNRTGKDIAQIINKYIHEKDFYSLFTGSAGVEKHIKAKKRNFNDIHPALFPYYTELSKGWVPSIDEFESKYNVKVEDYNKESFKKFYMSMVEKYKDSKNIDCPYVALLLFGCSFGGIWAGSIAKDGKKVSRNYLLTAINTLLYEAKAEMYNGIKMTNKDYQEFSSVKKSVFYLDPPYEDTAGYHHGSFNSNTFWEFVRKLSENNIVFVSEYKCPDDFVIIKQIEFTRGMSSKNKEGVVANEVVSELIVCHKSLVEKGIVEIEAIQETLF